MVETFEDARATVRALCARFPGEYWRALAADRSYPEAFVRALTEVGFRAALIPPDTAAAVRLAAAAAILEEIQNSGCNGAACHAQMYTIDRTDDQSSLVRGVL